MNKIYNAIMGLVVGDALGVPVEFKQRDTFKITDMTGYGTYHQPPGTWSDDSSMVLATMDSIVKRGAISPMDIMSGFYSWLEYGKYTPYGKVFDVGNTTKRAVYRYSQGVPLHRCGGRSRADNGNGALMRILPLAFVQGVGKQDILDVAHLTHAHMISDAACQIYIAIAQNLISGMGKEQAIEEAQTVIVGESMGDEFSRLPNLPYYSRDYIKSTGYVVDTLEAALWCLYHSDNYRDCVLLAVNLGGDTDTIAAVAGGLAGILWDVPDEWISQIARKDWIRDLCDRFKLVQDGSGCESGNLNR